MAVLEGVTPKPEAIYRQATSREERRRLQAAVITEQRPKFEAFVRRQVPSAHRQEGFQVAAIGILVALEKYDEEISGPDRGKKSFWGFAFPYVREELRRWMDHGVGWRNSKLSKSEKAALESRGGSTSVTSLEFLSESGIEFGTSDRAVDETAGDLEVLRRLQAFVSTLSVDEKELLFWRPGPGWSRLNSKNRALHCSLIERATAFVQGDEDGPRTGVRRSVHPAGSNADLHSGVFAAATRRRVAGD